RHPRCTSLLPPAPLTPSAARARPGAILRVPHTRGKVRPMEGTARRVQRAQEGATSILRFLLVSDDGASTAVEMRGSEIRGLLDDGDRVVMEPGSDPPAADGLHRPASVQNRTTGS